MAMAKHTMTLQATRGCPYECAYCHKIWPKTHFTRSAEHIFAEVKNLYDIGVRRFVFIDDIFNLQSRNCSEFFQRVIDNNMKIQVFFPNGLRGDVLTPKLIDLMVEGGTVEFDFSLESASHRVQKLVNKYLRLDRSAGTLNISGITIPRLSSKYKPFSVSHRDRGRSVDDS